MAGGMNKRGGGLPMHERVALAGGPRPAAPSGRSPATAPAAAPPSRSPARHCWVLDPLDAAREPAPALLVEWRHTDADEWEGRVLYLARLHHDQWVLVQEWVVSRRLSADAGGQR